MGGHDTTAHDNDHAKGKPPMTGYRIVPIADDVAAEVRRTLVAPGYGHPAHYEAADGHAPCRSCLRTFGGDGEERILFTHDAFAGVEEYPQPGPVFIHADACETYAETDRFPRGLRDKPLAFHAYHHGRVPVHQSVRPDVDPDVLLARLFADAEVDYVQVHSAQAGCFICRVVRDAGPPDDVSSSETA
jgi:hypothetical protein